MADMKIPVESLRTAPYSLNGAVIFGKEVKVRTMGKLLKTTLEQAYLNNRHLFTRMINSGRLYTARKTGQKSIIANTGYKHTLSQPSRIADSGMYIDTMISRDEALKALTNMINYLGLTNQIFVEIEYDVHNR